MLLFGEAWLRGNANYTRVSQGAQREPLRYSLGRAAPLALGWLTLVTAIGVGIPVGMLVYWFTQSSQAGFEGATANLRYLGPATYTTVGLGIAAAVVAILLALP